MSNVKSGKRKGSCKWWEIEKVIVKRIFIIYYVLLVGTNDITTIKLGEVMMSLRRMWKRKEDVNKSYQKLIV